MYQHVEPINSITHLTWGIKEMKAFSYAKELIHAPITIAEFYEACKDYPIVFAKDSSEMWTALALIGYQKKNLFIDEKGEWEKNRYIPAFIRRYPFIFIAQPKSEELTLAFDVTCKEENIQHEERAFFTKEGKATPFLENTMRFLTQFQNDAKATAEFIKQLSDWGLLEERMANIVTPSGETFTLNGFFVVNEEKLRHLSKKRKEEVYEKNVIPLITAHLISLSNVQRMGNK